MFYVLKITKNLTSRTKLLPDNEINMQFYNIVYVVKEKSRGITLLEGVAKGILYKLQCYLINPSKVSKFALVLSLSTKVQFIQESMLSFCFNLQESLNVISRAEKDLTAWHKMLGHPNVTSL